MKTIPHHQQRYETVGDYWYDRDILHLRVSEMNNPDYEFLVALHEFIESHLLQRANIPEPLVADFDKKFEEERKQGLHSEDDEPGNDPKAPYRQQHQWAEFIERLMALLLKIEWTHYEKEVMSL